MSFMNPARLDRALKIVEYLAHHQEGSALKPMCEDLGIPMSSAHDLVTALTELDAVRTSGQKTYVLGPRSLVLALSIVDSVDLRAPGPHVRGCWAIEALIDRLGNESRDFGGEEP